MQHGLAAARHLVIDGEDPAVFVAFEEALFEELDPQTMLEGELVKRIVSSLWRLRRVPEFEAALIAHHERQLRKDAQSRILDFDVGALGDDEPEAPTNEEARRLDLGAVLSRLLAHGVTDKLGRYEAGLRAQLSKSLEELRGLQADRRRAAPQIIDGELIAADRDEMAE